MLTLTDSIKKHEGLRLKPYRCSGGKLTIGYGRNLDDVGISKEEAEQMLTNDIELAEQLAHSFSWFDALDAGRQTVIIEMIFNLGFSGFLGFKKLIGALEQQDFDEAAYQMLDSRWAQQVGQRADDLAARMRA